MEAPLQAQIAVIGGAVATPTIPDGPRPTTQFGLSKSGTSGLFMEVKADAACHPTIRSL